MCRKSLCSEDLKLFFMLLVMSQHCVLVICFLFTMSIFQLFNLKKRFCLCCNSFPTRLMLAESVTTPLLVSICALTSAGDLPQPDSHDRISPSSKQLETASKPAVKFEKPLCIQYIQTTHAQKKDTLNSIGFSPSSVLSPESCGDNRRCSHHW